MNVRQDNVISTTLDEVDDLSRFADSYASFNRIINSLQRKYIELKEEFSRQNDTLLKTNRRLVEMTGRNLTATEFLNGILNSIAAGVIAVNEDGNITHFNPAASMMLGIPAAEPLGKAYRDMIPPGDPVHANALRSAETGTAVGSVEKRVELADSAQLIVSVSTAILKDKDDRPAGAVEVFHDLTKIKKLEREIARLNTLAALGQMAAAIAHQVRNPLSGILGYASLLKRDLHPDNPRMKLVCRITDGVETLNRTVTTLLSYTRNEELNRETIELDQFLKDAIRQFKRENIDLTTNMEFVLRRSERPTSEMVRLFIDPILFRQVLFNIFVNSCEACHGKSEIAISLRKLPRQTAAERHAEKMLLGLDETVVELVIADTGPGIAADVAEELFTPFSTTKEDGNGLGLAVAWKIIKAHGGEIVLDHEVSRGARFIILLPVRIGSGDNRGTDRKVTSMETTS